MNNLQKGYLKYISFVTQVFSPEASDEKTR